MQTDQGVMAGRAAATLRYRRQLDATVAIYADVLQIGARNMQNFALLHAVGESQHPVLLKRGMSATVEELLMARCCIA